MPFKCIGLSSALVDYIDDSEDLKTCEPTRKTHRAIISRQCCEFSGKDT